MRAPPGVPPGGTFVVSVPDAQTVQSYAAPKPASTEARSADAIATPSADALPPTTPTVQGRAAPLLDGRHLHQKSKSDVRRRRLVEVEVLCWGVKTIVRTRRAAAAAARISVYRRTVDGGHSGKVRKVPKGRAARRMRKRALRFLRALGDGGPNPKHAREAESKRRQREPDNVFVEVRLCVTFRIADPQLAASN